MTNGASVGIGGPLHAASILTARISAILRRMVHLLPTPIAKPPPRNAEHHERDECCQPYNRQEMLLILFTQRGIHRPTKCDDRNRHQD